MKVIKEKYVHFCTCIDNLNYSWNILKIVQEEQNKGNPLLLPAFQLALIEYTKPYGKSRGNVMNNHKLDTEYLPKKYYELHKRLLDARNQIHAHTDLTVKDADVYISYNNAEPHVGIVQNKVDLSEELKNIHEIIVMIESTLDNMYKAESKIKSMITS